LKEHFMTKKTPATSDQASGDRDRYTGLPGRYVRNAKREREPADEWTKNFVAQHFGTSAPAPAPVAVPPSSGAGESGTGTPADGQ
jgi:hypothetical protein